MKSTLPILRQKLHQVGRLFLAAVFLALGVNFVVRAVSLFNTPAEAASGTHVRDSFWKPIMAAGVICVVLAFLILRARPPRDSK
jgi:hypothetical protein